MNRDQVRILYRLFISMLDMHKKSSGAALLLKNLFFASRVFLRDVSASICNLTVS